MLGPSVSIVGCIQRLETNRNHYALEIETERMNREALNDCTCQSRYPDPDHDHDHDLSCLLSLVTLVFCLTKKKKKGKNLKAERAVHGR